MTISSLDAAKAQLGDALSKLVDLGDDAGSVATTLEMRGVAGERGTSTNCPVAVYLRDELDPENWRGISVGSRCISAIASTAAGRRCVTTYTIPPGIEKFIEEFDAGTAYPKLAVS